MTADLESDLKDSPIVFNFCLDRNNAEQLYDALCNNQFSKQGGEPWLCSWRYAGSIVAEIRDKGEDYMDFYCSGNESKITQQVHEILQGLGWEVVKKTLVQ